MGFYDDHSSRRMMASRNIWFLGEKKEFEKMGHFQGMYGMDGNHIKGGGNLMEGQLKILAVKF